MTPLDTIRAAHVALLQSIPEIGRVHDYERYSAREAEFRALYVATIGGHEQLRGWYVRRATTEERSEVFGDYENTHVWTLRGFMAIDDASASEKTFDGLIEAVRDAYRADPTLGGTVASVYARDGNGPRLVESQPVLFGGVLCHAARLQVTTWLTL